MLRDKGMLKLNDTNFILNLLVRSETVETLALNSKQQKTTKYPLNFHK